MAVTAAVRQLEDPAVYQPSSVFDPRVADLAQKILREKCGQTDGNMNHNTVEQSTSVPDQIQALQVLREGKQSALWQLREEILALDNQLQTLEAKQQRMVVLRRASSWPGTSTQGLPALLV